MPQVQAIKTTWDDAEDFVWDVHEAFMRQNLSDLSARLLTAHVANSTGWGKSCWNWTLAGIKATSEDQDYYVKGGSERIGGELVPGQMHWRSWNSLDEGAAAMVSLLQAPRYAASWALLQAGDPGYFAQVGRDGWYTEYPEVVSRDMTSRLQQINAWLGAPDAAAGGAGLLVGLLLVGGIAWWYFRG